ncbi:hypothetical protein [Compostimonas suwonensis]|uniref:hypothetical protein n=1 Tax=Compostimonas suwonensis TaxID=1048394 RepID=UPI000C23F9E8|nr:hypothetical protein [Compostimonas suwonensis]
MSPSAARSAPSTQPKLSAGSSRRFWTIATIASLVTAFALAGALTSAPSSAQASGEPSSVDAAGQDLAGPSSQVDASSPSAADEVTTPGPTDSPTTTPAVPSVTIDSPADGDFVTAASVTVSGSRDSGSAVQLYGPDTSHPECVIDSGSTSWSCADVPVDSGPDITFRAIELAADGSRFETTTSVDVLLPPTIDENESGEVVSAGAIRGTAYPGARVTATASNGASCTSNVDRAGAWQCALPGPMPGGSYTITAQQTADWADGGSSDPSESVTLLIDSESPAPPVISSPVPGSTLPAQGAVYSGTGEEGATVTVFAGAYSLCSAPVTGGVWSCTAGELPPGDYSVTALQLDVAGNASSGSPAFPVVVSGPATPDPAPTPTPSSSPGSTPSPSATDDPSQPPTSPPGAGAPPSDPGSPAPGTPGAPGSAPPRGEAAPPPPGAFRGWTDATPFASAIRYGDEGAGFPAWLRSLLLALAALVLVAVPAALALRTAGPLALPRLRASLTGRNRPRRDVEHFPELSITNRWVTRIAALIAAAALITLSGPVDSQPAYLRLLGGVALALVIVNAVAAVVPAWVGRRWGKVAASVAFAPRFLFLVAAASLATRLFDLQPALLFGLVVGVSIADGAGVRTRGLVALGQIAGLVVVGSLAWGLLPLIPAPDGFLSSLASETLTAIALGGLGSAAVVILPIGALSGRAVLHWSRTAWIVSAIVVYTLLFAIMSPAIDVWQQTGAALTTILCAIGFAAVCVSFWVWRTFVEPNRE